MRRFIVTSAVLAACISVAFSQEDVTKKLAEESRNVAAQVAQQLRDQLLKEMQLSGPVRSLVVCKYACPQITLAQSRKAGWRVSFVTLKPRNPGIGTPDVWEQRVLTDFNRRVAKGEKAEELEYFEVVSEPQGKYFRYLKAMAVEPVCLACHGRPETLPAPVRAQLAIDYPADKATGYSAGQVLGAVTIKRPF